MMKLILEPDQTVEKHQYKNPPSIYITSNK